MKLDEVHQVISEGLNATDCDWRSVLKVESAPPSIPKDGTIEFRFMTSMPDEATLMEIRKTTRGIIKLLEEAANEFYTSVLFRINQVSFLDSDCRELETRYTSSSLHVEITLLGVDIEKLRDEITAFTKNSLWLPVTESYPFRL